MSANNAPGEVDKDKIFDSPNISSATDEENESEVDKAAEEQKKRETVEIDGIPIEDKDIKYKAEDINKKGKINFFVNVEGAEERAKAEAKKAETDAKKAEAEKRAAEMRVETEKRASEREAKEARIAEDKKQAEQKKHIEEVNAYIKRQESQNSEKRTDRKRANDFKNKLKELFWNGKRKIFTLALSLSVILIVVIASFVITSIKNTETEEQLIADGLAEVQSMEEMPFRQAVLKIDNNEILDNALVNYNFDEVDEIYDEIIKTLSEDIDIARVYMDKAYRIMDYHPEEVERIVHAAELAYSYAPDELSIANDLYSIYMFAEMPDKAAEIDYKLQQINLKFQAEAGETQGSEEPYYNEEDF